LALPGGEIVIWTKEAVALLRKRYPDTLTADLARTLNRSSRSVYEKAAQLGIKKSAEFFSSSKAGRTDGVRGSATRFQKGLVPWNKGLKGYTAGGRSAETRFKPGHRTGRAHQLYRPIGAERISKDGYLERKIHDGLPMQSRWRAVHILLWEKHHGALPKGHAVVFRNSDKADIRIENLDLVTRNQLMRLNSYHNYPKDIAQAIQLRGALNRKINQAAKEAAR
jgi:hypothetical protein